MKRIVYAPHLKLRIELRSIPHDLPADIYKTAKERYLDRKTGLLVAVAEADYRGRVREMALTYKESVEEILLITLHPLKRDQRLNRIKSERWQKL